MKKHRHEVIPVQLEFNDLNDYWELVDYDFDFRNYELRTTQTPEVYKIYNKDNKLSYTGTIENLRKKVIKLEFVNEKKFWENKYQGMESKFKDRFLDQWYEFTLKDELMKMFDYLNTYFPENIDTFLKKKTLSDTLYEDVCENDLLNYLNEVFN